MTFLRLVEFVLDDVLASFELALGWYANVSCIDCVLMHLYTREQLIRTRNDL